MNVQHWVIRDGVDKLIFDDIFAERKDPSVEVDDGDGMSIPIPECSGN